MTHRDRITRRVAAEQDDVLATLLLVAGERLLEDHLYRRLVDLLVEALFLDLRGRLAEGEISQDVFWAELASLAEACRSAGLLPVGVPEA